MKGVLLINLGSPDTTETKDVKRYLGEFLMDERVIDVAYWKRFLLIKGIILQIRPKKSGAAYKKIWWDEGSPLVVISERFSKKVTKKVEIPVSLAMRYGSMSMEKGFKELTDQGVDEILLVPLYPHYAMSSYETVTVKAEQIVAKEYPNVIMDILLPRLRVAGVSRLTKAISLGRMTPGCATLLMLSLRWCTAHQGRMAV